MALTFSQTTGPAEVWYQGSEKPLVKTAVIKVYADGDELEYILNRFKNIPYTFGKTCVWNGETAQFIYDNLT